MEDLQTPEPETPESAESPNSVRAMLRERWEGIQKAETLDLSIPMVPEDVLKVRYHSLPSEELDKLGKKIANSQQKGSVAAVKFNADFLIRCCQAILVPISADEDAPMDVLVDDEGDPIVFDVRLARFLGFEDEVESARQVVFTLFSKAPQPDIALVSHAEKIANWMQGVQANTSETLLGF